MNLASCSFSYNSEKRAAKGSLYSSLNLPFLLSSMTISRSSSSRSRTGRAREESIAREWRGIVGNEDAVVVATHANVVISKVFGEKSSMVFERWLGDNHFVGMIGISE